MSLRYDYKTEAHVPFSIRKAINCNYFGLQIALPIRIWSIEKSALARVQYHKIFVEIEIAAMQLECNFIWPIYIANEIVEIEIAIFVDGDFH